jgi:hypothetical protein
MNLAWLRACAHALLVAVALTLCDALGHVQYAALIYADPSPGSLYPGQPTAEVALGFLGMGGFVTAVGGALVADTARPGVGATLASVLAFAAAYLSSGPFGGWPMTLHVVYVATWWLHLLTFPAAQRGRWTAWSVLLGLLGPVFEGAYAGTGFFHYVDADAFGVPLWLMGIYLHGALAVARTTRWMQG